MVLGLGIDIIEIARIRRTMEVDGEGFLRKVFTAGEIAYCGGKADPAQHYAARFAAKEAVSKAMSTGWSGEFRWRDVEVMNAETGAPAVVLHGRIAERLGACRVLISLSHSDAHVVAAAVIEGPGVPVENQTPNT
jgi:holo-[acyl-carrier protein] synthase